MKTSTLEIVFQIITIVLGIITIVFGIKSYLAQKNNDELEDRLHILETTIEKNKRHMKEIRRYVYEHPVPEYRYVDVILLGPRYAGKTSIGRIWTSPWTRISSIKASHEWESYEANIYEFEEKKQRDTLFETLRPYIPTLRLRVYDYPGEPSYRSKALDDLNYLQQKVVLLFIFQVGFSNGQIQYSRENAEYFSRVFVEEIERHIHRISSKIAKAIIVFNKVDLLPQEWDDDRIFIELKRVNADGIHQIERIFSGILDFHITSAYNNYGIISLLGKVGRVAVPEGQEKRFNSAFHN